MLSKNQIKFIKGLSLKKNRIQHQLFTVEGTKGITEFIKSPFFCEAIYTTETSLFRDNDPEIVSKLDLERMSQLKNANQCIALFRIPEYVSYDKSGLIVALDDIKDPGNLGTIIRLCDWFGVKDILCSVATVDCYNSKVVQASMGSLSRVRLHYLNLKDEFERYSGHIYGTFLNGASIYETTFQQQGIVLMGNEANGISPDLEGYVTQDISIPQYGNLHSTESLNVATATAICLAEIKRTI